jgi:hypothetical protein
MAKGRKSSGPKSLQEKVDDKYPQYSAEVMGLSVPQLDQRIAELQKTLEDAVQFQEEKNGEAMKSLAAQLKDLRADLSEVKKAVSLKTKYLVSLVREKGGA